MGYSLGIAPLPRKTCSMDCIYCEVGRTDRWTMERREWVPTEDVLAEVEQKLTEGHHIDVITFSGSGEPVLHSRLGEMIDRIHGMTDIPVCVLTNGSHMHDPGVRAEVAKAEIVAPSLDAVSPEVFERINKPHPDLRVDDVIEGLRAFRKEYSGQIWLEILFVAGFNDDGEEVGRLVDAVSSIRPDRIHLNTVVRPPAYDGIAGLSPERLEEIRRRFGPTAEVVSTPRVEERPGVKVDLYDLVVETASRRPMTRHDLADAIGRPLEEVEAVVERLIFLERISERLHEGNMFLEVPHEVDTRRSPRTRKTASGRASDRPAEV
jgi:wyosine [tRNA(Phe)-imidazoG37] synthetase (radical SAM superfamily)